MAMWVFDRSGQRSAAKIAAGRQVGEGFRDAAFIIADSMNRYAERKQREEEKQLAVMGVLAKTYSFQKMGPDFTRKFEDLSGIKFPRDSSGQPVVPQTDQEAFDAKFGAGLDATLSKDPELAGEIAMFMRGYTSQPKSTSERALADRKMSLEERKARVEEKYDGWMASAAMRRAEAQYLRASQPGAGSRPRAGEADSEYVRDPRNPKGIPLHWQDPDAPPNAPRMTEQQVATARGMIDFDKQKTTELKQLFYESLKDKTEYNDRVKWAVQVMKNPVARRDRQTRLTAEGVIREASGRWKIPIEEGATWYEKLFSGIKEKDISSMPIDPNAGVDLPKAAQGLPSTSAEKALGPGMTPDQIRTLAAQRKAQGMTDQQFVDQWEQMYPGQSLRIAEILQGIN